MTILDLIKKTAVIFNIEAILKDSNLNEVANEAQLTILSSNSQLNRMFELTKVVLCEVYSYANKEIEVTANAIDCQIDKSSLGNVGRIVLVRNQYGKANYRIIDDRIMVEHDGEYVIKCVVAPSTDYLNNEIDMLNGAISEDMLINGLNAYYCLTAGLFEEYNVYNGRYLDGFSKLKNSKLFAMPCRSWHE